MCISNSSFEILFGVSFSYIVWGALLFGRWEDWNYLDGSYFCFISLSSIGFGDLVPGERVVSDRPQSFWTKLSFTCESLSTDNFRQRQGWSEFYSLWSLSAFGYGTDRYVFQFDASSCYIQISWFSSKHCSIQYYPFNFRSKLYIICVLLKQRYSDAAAALDSSRGYFRYQMLHGCEIHKEYLTIREKFVLFLVKQQMCSCNGWCVNSLILSFTSWWWWCYICTFI